MTSQLYKIFPLFSNITFSLALCPFLSLSLSSSLYLSFPSISLTHSSTFSLSHTLFHFLSLFSISLCLSFPSLSLTISQSLSLSLSLSISFTLCLCLSFPYLSPSLSFSPSLSLYVHKRIFFLSYFSFSSHILSRKLSQSCFGPLLAFPSPWVRFWLFVSIS